MTPDNVLALIAAVGTIIGAIGGLGGLAAWRNSRTAARQADVDALVKVVDKLQEENERLRRRVEELEQANHRLRERVEELEKENRDLQRGLGCVPRFRWPAGSGEVRDRG